MTRMAASLKVIFLHPRSSPSRRGRTIVTTRLKAKTKKGLVEATALTMAKRKHDPGLVFNRRRLVKIGKK
jgi:hypothetical protein